MGEMAHWLLEQVADEEEARLEFRTGHMDYTEAFERGIIDSLGYEIGPGGRRTKKRWKKPSGPGPCPLCRSETVLRNGKFGEFYGCSRFPNCKGSRNKRKKGERRRVQKHTPARKGGKSKVRRPY